MVLATFFIGTIFENLLCSNFDAVVEREASRQHTLAFLHSSSVFY